ncbi:DNA mismatch repair protein MutT [Bacteroidota bacterium]|nr:DNA mismatch repair protein MutT [Bacteroidota bacterium]
MDNSRYISNQNITVAIDCVIFGFDLKKLNLLLFKRRVSPFKGSWSLIGEVLENNISLNQSATDILSKLTGLENIYLKQLKTYGALNRDPQERVISIVYFSLIRVDKLSLKMVENYDAKWFAFNELPELILDHSQMVKDSISELRNIAKDQPLGFELLPKLFTLPQLQTLYECIYNTKFDSRNFRKKILSLNILEKTNLKDKSTSRKGAYLFGFKENVLNNYQKDEGTYNTKDVFQF